MAKVYRIGLTQLSPNDDASSSAYRVNIIFVHGLRGHPQETWEASRAGSDSGEQASTPSKRRTLKSLFKSKTPSPVATEDDRDGFSSADKVFWPAEFLLPDLPNARLWTYGYNADVIGGMFEANNRNSVSQHGQDLSVKLRREIENQDPIIFVAHSLGGIIVKDALRRSPPSRSQTRAIVFLGTPHRGSSLAEWGKIASNLASFALQNSNKGILSTLKVNGEVFDIIQDEFQTIVHEHNIKIHSFQEARGISGIKGLSGKVVDDFSSKVGLPAQYETVESIDANHMQMAKCKAKSDPQYRAICGVLRQFINGGLDQSRDRAQVPGQPNSQGTHGGAVVRQAGEVNGGQGGIAANNRMPSPQPARLGSSVSSQLNPNDYTVAWIAPLEIEARAALQMLDERHRGKFLVSRGDDYVFHAGTMCGHNIIIATLPASQEYGTGSAAALASQVRKFFPNLWFGLLVGVAAGLPNLSRKPPRDIRLGDVLVGLPEGESAGLIAYDLGKETEDGFELLRSGHVLAMTEPIVRSAIGSIKLEVPNDVDIFLPYYEAIRDKEHASGTFRDPGQDQDRLYLTQDDGTEELVERSLRPESRRTRAWYGPIGSGDKLLKNAQKRNELRDKYDVIGLEMEAAGTMNRIPVGVVRGVCDYGDRHKNKEWQPYAAAMAAAYAKAILAQIPVRS